MLMASSSARSRAAAAADAVAAELRATAAAHDFISPADAAAAPPSVMDRMIRDLEAGRLLARRRSNRCDGDCSC